MIPQLVEANGVPWGDTRQDAIVDIESFGGIENLLEPGVIETEAKASGLKALGIVVDANADGPRRWQQVRKRCARRFPGLPEKLPRNGLIHSDDPGLRFGVWIMPDNSLAGMLETFMAHLVPDAAEEVWKHAKQCVDDARLKGAPVRETHLDKARIHTWLAWQDPPGSQLHHAVLKRTLDPKAPSSKPFIEWFRALFEI